MAEFVKVLVNDVVYYLHLNNGNSTKESIINACMKEFSETEILNAKAYLLEGCSLDIRKLNMLWPPMSVLLELTPATEPDS